MNYLSVCAIFKEETRWLKEWLEYYKLLGVEKFYMFNNDIDYEEAYPVLKPYIDSGVVVGSW